MFLTCRVRRTCGNGAAISARTAIWSLGILAITAAVVLATVGYLRRRSSNRAVHRMHEHVRRARQAELERLARVEAKKCTYAAEMCETLNSLASEAAASMRTGLELLEAGQQYAPTCAIEGGEPGCQSHVELIEQLLFEQRAMLPPAAFGLMHDVRTTSVAFEATARKLSGSADIGAQKRRLARLREQLEQADGGYRALVAEVQDFLGECAGAPVDASPVRDA